MSAGRFPGRWSKELVRNPSGRAFWFVSRFIGPGEVEYTEAPDGSAKCYRLEKDADAAVAKGNDEYIDAGLTCDPAPEPPGSAA